MAAGLAERPHRQIAGANDARPREARPGARQRRRVADHARMIIGESLLVQVFWYKSPVSRHRRFVRQFSQSAMVVTALKPWKSKCDSTGLSIDCCLRISKTRSTRSMQKKSGAKGLRRILNLQTTSKQLAYRFGAVQSA